MFVESGCFAYLAIEGGGINARPEEREQVGVRAELRVEHDPNNLHVIGNSRADQFVSWMWSVALRVTNLGFDHAFKSLEGKLCSPKAASAELCKLIGWVFRDFDIGV